LGRLDAGFDTWRTAAERGRNQGYRAIDLIESGWRWISIACRRRTANDRKDSSATAHDRISCDLMDGIQFKVPQQTIAVALPLKAKPRGDRDLSKNCQLAVISDAVALVRFD
jgi:hypothetical protein